MVGETNGSARLKWDQLQVGRKDQILLKPYIECTVLRSGSSSSVFVKLWDTLTFSLHDYETTFAPSMPGPSRRLYFVRRAVQSRVGPRKSPHSPQPQARAIRDRRLCDSAVLTAVSSYTARLYAVERSSRKSAAASTDRGRCRIQVEDEDRPQTCLGMGRTRRAS